MSVLVRWSFHLPLPPVDSRGKARHYVHMFSLRIWIQKVWTFFIIFPWWVLAFFFREDVMLRPKYSTRMLALLHVEEHRRSISQQSWLAARNVGHIAIMGVAHNRLFLHPNNTSNSLMTCWVMGGGVKGKTFMLCNHSTQSGASLVWESRKLGTESSLDHGPLNCFFLRHELLGPQYPLPQAFNKIYVERFAVHDWWVRVRV